MWLGSFLHSLCILFKQEKSVEKSEMYQEGHMATPTALQNTLINARTEGTPSCPVGFTAITPGSAVVMDNGAALLDGQLCRARLISSCSLLQPSFLCGAGPIVSTHCLLNA